MYFLTKFSSVDREIFLQQDPLLDLLSVGRGSIVEFVDALLNGFVERRLPFGYDLWHLGGPDVEVPTELHRLGAQGVCGVALVVHYTLRTQQHRSHLFTDVAAAFWRLAEVRSLLLWAWAAWRGTSACLRSAWRCWWWESRASRRPRWGRGGCSPRRRWWWSLQKKKTFCLNFLYKLYSINFH